MVGSRIASSKCSSCFHAGAIVDVSGAEPFVTCFAANAACGRMMKLADVADCKLYRPKRGADDESED